MNVENIRLINFRNYNSVSVEFNKNVNVFVGKNAQGKTNLLEAIYMCATGRSFRTNRDKEIINFQKKEAYVAANVFVGRFDKFIELKLDREKTKIIRMNKTELKNYKELNTGLSVIVFSPDDLKLIKDGPSERRSFMDMGISQLKPVYNYNLSRYNKVLFQRNNILRSNKFKRDLLGLLDVFDMQLSKMGTSIVLERKMFVDELYKICRETHNRLTLNNEELMLKYNSNIPILDNKAEMEKLYLKLLKDNNGKDIECGTTEIGPHRDDMLTFINDKDAKTFGSQGQQRTIVLTLKLSEVELIKKDRGSYPIVLLDDVFSELDEDRRRHLTKSFNEMQTFITVTDAVDIKSIDNVSKSIFHIEDGSLEKVLVW